MKNYFTSSLIDWHLKENKRIMPWKGEKDPYKIWISEIILQQTRVAQGLSYYNNFIREFPTVKSLASAPEETVFKVWEGLGYYSRCKNLLYTARDIVNNHEGRFPDTYNTILQLKGVGPYTAAAIASFAYGLPHAVVDGNVFRVLSRYFGEAIPVDSTKGKALFTNLANFLMEKENSSSFNQAIMDFGATVCTPQNPGCGFCALRKKCTALHSDRVSELPVKEKQIRRKSRFFTYLVFTKANAAFIRKRTGKDIWENLFEFYLIESETESKWSKEGLEKWLSVKLGITGYSVIHFSKRYKQQLTHQLVHGNFIKIQIPSFPTSLTDLQEVQTKQLPLVAFPKLINQYLAEYPFQEAE